MGLFSVPTPAPEEPVYYVTFIITNTYGKDVYLRTSLPSPFNKFMIINGNTVRMPIKVPTQQVVTFEAFVRGTEESITINNKGVFPIIPRDNPDEVTVLKLPELIGMFIDLLQVIYKATVFFNFSLMVVHCDVHFYTPNVSSDKSDFGCQNAFEMLGNLL
jgi:hypothetical protein